MDEIGNIIKQLNKLTDPDWVHGFSKSQIDEIMNKSRKLINTLSDKMLLEYASKTNMKFYNKQYKQVAGKLRKLGYKIGNTPVDTGYISNQIKRSLREFKGKVDQAKPYMMNVLDNRLNTSDTMVKTTNRILQEQKKIDKLKGISRIERERLTRVNVQRVKPLFKPRTTLMKLSDKSDNRVMGKQIETSQEAIQNKLQQSFREKWSNTKIRNELNAEVAKKFPNGKVYSTYTDKNGVKRVWSQDTKEYTANWEQYARTRQRSESTIDAMIQVGADITEYTLVGSNHTTICIDLNAGDPYSISGESPNYPPLPIAPPAHFGCKSVLTPLTRDKQEYHDKIPDDRRDDLFNDNQPITTKDQKKIIQEVKEQPKATPGKKATPKPPVEQLIKQLPKIKGGKITKTDRELDYNKIVKETDKAVLVEIEIEVPSGKELTNIWLPKSKLKSIDDKKLVGNQKIIDEKITDKIDDIAGVRNVKIGIVKETDNAILVRVGDMEALENLESIWLPKSQITFDKDVATIPSWLYKKKMQEIREKNPDFLWADLSDVSAKPVKPKIDKPIKYKELDTLKEMDTFVNDPNQGFTKWADKLTNKEIDALEDYGFTKYRDINQYMRTGEVETLGLKKDEYYYASLNRAKLSAKEISSALSKMKLQDNIITYRGFIDPDLIKSYKDNNIIGKKYSDKSFMSTSLSKDIAERFLRNNDSDIVFIGKIKVKKGTEVGIINIEKDLSKPIGKQLNMRGEKEILLQHDQPMIIKSVKESDIKIEGKTVVEIEFETI